MKLALMILVVFVAFDGIATGYLVGYGYATEANPIADFFLQASPILLGVVKLVEVILGCLWLYQKRTKFSVKIAVFLLLLLYFSIAILHTATLLYWTAPISEKTYRQ